MVATTNGHANGTANGKVNGNSNGHTAVSSSSSDTSTLAPVQRLFVLSAKTESSLAAYQATFDEYLDEAPDTADFAKQLSYTLGQRRSHHAYRIAVVAASAAGLQEKLLAAKPTRTKTSPTNAATTIAFVFTGQGAQHAQMASGLAHHAVFATALAAADAFLADTLGAPWSLAEELARPAGPASRVDAAEISQPACTAVQLALVLLLASWGIAPRVVTGHSSGEIGAAFAAGLLSFETALAVAYFRGQAAARLLRQQGQGGGQNRARGAMVALGAGVDEAEALIEAHAGGYATVAAINSPQSVTISGDEGAVGKVLAAAEAQGVFARRLKVDMAYHSRHMEDVADWYLEAIKPFFSNNDEGNSKNNHRVQNPGPVLFVSSVTGRAADTAEIDAHYWVKNLVQPVLFANAIQTLFTPTDKQPKSVGRKGSAVAPNPNVLIEIGPHPALKGPVKQTLDSISSKVPSASAVTYLASLARNTAGDEALLALAGALYTLGAPGVRLGGVNQTGKDNTRVLTGLPAYQWDKATSYESRPRFTHEKLFPGDAYHPLLGRRLASSGGRERSYRQVFTLDEAPWLRDHNVAGAVVFPMTGYMSMAIEAARRTLPTTGAGAAPAAAFLVKDFHVVARLEIQEEQQVDMLTKLRPAATGTGHFSATAWSFDISSYSEAERAWTVHTYGQIEPETTDMAARATPTLSASLALVDTAPDLLEHDISRTYEQAGVRATRYGPTFQNSVRFFEGKGYTILEHKLRDIPETTADQQVYYGSPVTVDPPTLDGFLQGGGPLQVDEDGRRPAQMPNYISRFRVSNTIPAAPGQRIDIVTRLLDYDFKGGRMHIGVAAFARSGATLTPVAEWESLAFRSIGSADDDMDPASSLPDNWAWTVVPKVDFQPPDTVARKLTAVGGVAREDVAHGLNLEKAAHYFIRRALQETAGDDRSKLPYHLSQFLKWADRNVASTRTETNPGAEAELAGLVEAVRSHNAQGELLCIIGEALVPILRQEVEPLELMLADGRLTRHYEADVMNAYLSSVLGDVAEMVRDLEGPGLRILEIGAGTAGTTLPVIEALTRNEDGTAGDPAATNFHLTFTDISTGFFENARVKLAPWAQRITYKKLDVGQDPAAQGFEPGGFDVVIAANVLHATQDMGATMAHVRTLLKPRGRLLLLEGNRHPASLLPFFLLPGWWYAEDQYRDRDEGPMMAVSVWDRLLKDTGFSGVDLNLHDLPDEAERAMSIIVSTRVGSLRGDQAGPRPPIIVSGPFLDDNEVDFAQTVADAIAESLGDYPTEIRPLAELDPAERPYYVFIDSPRAGATDDVTTSEAFDSLQQLLVHNAGLLWVVPEGGPPGSKFIKGMVRTLRLENEAKNLLLLDDAPLTAAGAAAIARLAEQLRDPEPTRSADQDFVWHDGSVHVPRMRLLGDVKEQFAVERGISFRTEQDMWAGDRALEMTIDAAGSPDSIYYRRTDDLQTPLADDDVVIQVEAAGVSHRDLSLVLGNMPWSPPGFDGAGRIVRTGSKVAGVQQGDAVFFLAAEGSAFATYKKLPAWQVAKVPAGMSTTDAASLPLAYTIAVLALVHTARLTKGQTVLVHAAAGAVGQACVVLAQHIGAEVYATAGTADKRAFLQSAFHIPADHIFSSRDARFRDGILTATRGRGVDVVINSLGGELMVETWALTAEFGRFVEVGNKDARQNAYLPMRPFDRGVTFGGVDVRALAKHRPHELRAVLADLTRLLGAGVVVPIRPVVVLPISDFPKALSRLRGGESMGKVVVTLGRHERVMAESALRPLEWRGLRADATYLITGGTRGIGLNLAYWMLDNGARNVVVLGRSGGSGPEAQKFLSKYEGVAGVTVRALACDVGVREELAAVLESIKDLPPVRGVVHSALLLSVSLFRLFVFRLFSLCPNRVSICGGKKAFVDNIMHTGQTVRKRHVRGLGRHHAAARAGRVEPGCAAPGQHGLLRGARLVPRRHGQRRAGHLRRHGGFLRRLHAAPHRARAAHGDHRVARGAGRGLRGRQRPQQPAPADARRHAHHGRHPHHRQGRGDGGGHIAVCARGQGGGLQHLPRGPARQGRGVALLPPGAGARAAQGGQAQEPRRRRGHGQGRRGGRRQWRGGGVDGSGRPPRGAHRGGHLKGVGHDHHCARRGQGRCAAGRLWARLAGVGRAAQLDPPRDERGADTQRHHPGREPECPGGRHLGQARGRSSMRERESLALHSDILVTEVWTGWTSLEGE